MMDNLELKTAVEPIHSATTFNVHRCAELCCDETIGGISIGDTLWKQKKRQRLVEQYGDGQG